MPELKFEVKDVLVGGGPWNTTVVARWVGRCTLENGEPYANPGIHVIELRGGKALDFDVYEDVFAVTAGHEDPAKAGIEGAAAAQIVG